MSLFRTRLDLQWEVGRHAAPDTGDCVWYSATVPGAVQLDWARAHNLPDYTVGENLQQWADLDTFWWTYRARLGAMGNRGANDRVFVVLKGVDYACDVFIDGECVAAWEGLQRAFECDITERWHSDAVLTVRIKPAPKSRPAPLDRTQADHACKPAVSYGWDFHPRLIPLGLWNEAYLEIRPLVHLAGQPYLAYHLDETCRTASGRLEVALSAPATAGLVLRWRLLAPDGANAHSVETMLAGGERQLTLPFVLPEVALWWPHDQGEAALYTSRVELVTADGRILDSESARVGFRRVRLVMAPDQWSQPTAFPKSRSYPPITFEVNGRALFVKGTNWVCPDVFPGTMTRERFAAQLALVRATNLSLVRVWGGAVAPQDSFFELCDELGLMVWQEFPLACNRYPDDDAYLAVLDAESRAMIQRLRHHASLVLWCGGNELFNAWSGMTDQSLPLRLLNRNCYELDPSRPFLPTAPLEGMGHGHYVFRDPVTGEEAWAMFQDARCTAYSEFGCAGPAAEAILRKILPPEEQWPPRAGTAWETHHAFGAWLPSSHLYLDQIDYYFGASASLTELVERGQLLQSMGYQGLFEEARRQKPVASLALNWCFNEPWPCAANNSLVSWPCEPKPALVAVRHSCRPTLASARIRKASWRSGDVFEIELWLLHDGPDAPASHQIVATLEIDGARLELGQWTPPASEPNRNVTGPRLGVNLPELPSTQFALQLDVPTKPEWSSRYTLLRARDHSAEPVATVEIPAGTTNF